MAKRTQKGYRLSASKIILYAAGSGALLGSGYLAYNFFRDINLGNSGKEVPDATQQKAPTAQNTLPKPAYHDAFPLKVGDKNWYVQQLQLALIHHGNKAAQHINNSGGADGIFGQGTIDALMAAGYKSYFETLLGATVTAQQYERILNKGSFSGLEGLAFSPKLAVTRYQTYLLTADSLRKAIPEAYPVMQGITLGYFLDEQAGLARIQTEEGDIFYTASASIELL
jgi:hypothetical protein